MKYTQIWGLDLDVCKRMVTARLQDTGSLLLLYMIHPLILPKEMKTCTHTHTEHKNNPWEI